MKLNKIYITILFCSIIATAVLTSTVLDLSAQKKEHQATIERLNTSVAHLQGDVKNYKQEIAESNKKTALFKFKSNAIQSKYPKFAQISEIVFRKSKEYGFSPYLIMSLIQVESNFESYAVSNAGAYGLMQVNYSVWKDYLNIDYNRIFKKEYNIDLGLKVLKHYYDKTGGNMFMALYRYNNGYKYNNTSYNGKIVSTKFFNHDKKSKEAASKKGRSI